MYTLLYDKLTLHLLCENCLNYSKCLEVFVFLCCDMEAAVLCLICEGCVIYKMGQKFVNYSYIDIYTGNAASFVYISESNLHSVNFNFCEENFLLFLLAQ